jgi:hypothetical protein
LDRSTYQILKAKAIETAEKIGSPSFYDNHKKELASSTTIFSNNKMVQRCMAYLDEAVMHPAHGIKHCEKVAIEAGAILLIECAMNTCKGSRTEDLLLCVQIAGLLHDIKRREKNHTIAGSIEAEMILNEFDIEKSYKRYIIAAIRNHEAFQEVLDSENETAKLISDSLYDADKFRWGPDNFTTTLWLMMESSGTPVEILYNTFQEKIEGIRRIKNTFRTDSGKKYGPEFIDLGIEIGDEINRELTRIIGD